MILDCQHWQDSLYLALIFPKHWLSFILLLCFAVYKFYFNLHLNDARWTVRRVPAWKMNIFQSQSYQTNLIKFCHLIRFTWRNSWLSWVSCLRHDIFHHQRCFAGIFVSNVSNHIKAQLSRCFCLVDFLVWDVWNLDHKFYIGVGICIQFFKSHAVSSSHLSRCFC